LSLIPKSATTGVLALLVVVRLRLALLFKLWRPVVLVLALGVLLLLVLLLALQLLENHSLILATSRLVQKPPLLETLLLIETLLVMTGGHDTGPTGARCSEWMLLLFGL
jgi:hypothetical protein